MRWRTSDIVALLTDPQWAIRVEPAGGGDFDTEYVIMELHGKPGCRIFVHGFHDDNVTPFTDPSDAEITKIEVFDGKDGRGGWDRANRDSGHMYVEICCRLSETYQVEIVDTLDSCF